MSRIKLTGETAIKYLKKYPLMPSRTMARKLFAENKPLFNSVDHARQLVRGYRGTKGEKMRKRIKVREFFVIPQIAPMPKSDARPWPPFVIDNSINNTIVLADIHVPYHIEDKLARAIKEGKKRKVDSIILLGDILDCYQLSKFVKDPRKRRFVDELKALNQLLDHIQGNFPNAKTFYKYGNHENRLNTYIMVSAPELFGMDGMNLASQIKAVDRGIQIIDEQRRIRYGKMGMVHGDEGRGVLANPVSPARGGWLKLYASACVAHLHQASSQSEKNMWDDEFTVHSLGCLCDLHPAYSRINKWAHGFAIVQKDKSGNFSFENFRILKDDSVRPA